MPINTKLVPETVLNRIKANRSVYQAARAVRMSVGSLIGARNIPGISGRVHFNDFMLDSNDAADVEHYARGGYETVTQLESALAAGGRRWADVRSVLEFGCGYGRITRALVQKIDPSKVTVCDVIEEGPKFCVQEFHVKSVPGTSSIAGFVAEPSDLVFFLSVHTHLSERRLEDLQRKLMELVAPGGICFFTTMGLSSASQAERYGARWAQEKSNILKELEQHGFAFHPYGYYNDPDYGMTWETYEHSTSLLRRLHGGRFRLLRFEDGAHDHHQDIYVYQRIA